MASELFSFKASESIQARIAEMSKARGLNRSATIKAAILEASPAAEGAVADKDELLGLMTEQARGGNVTAMKTLWQILTALEREDQAGDTVDDLDELAVRRSAA